MILLHRSRLAPLGPRASLGLLGLFAPLLVVPASAAPAPPPAARAVQGLAEQPLSERASDPRYRAGIGLLNRGLHAEAIVELSAFLDDGAGSPRRTGPPGERAEDGKPSNSKPSNSKPSHSNPSDAKPSDTAGDPTIDTARYALALCHARLDQLADAARQLDRISASSRFPHAADAAMLRAQCAIAQEQWELAESTLEALLAAHPAFSSREIAQTMRGEALLRAGRPREAVQALDAAAGEWAARPTAADPGAALADVRWRDRCELLCAVAQSALGDDEAALRRLAALRARSPQGELAAEAALREAQTLQRLSRHAECLERCGAAIAAATDPSTREQLQALQRRSLLALGDAALERGDHADAESRFAELRPLCDGAELHDALLRLGVSIQRQGRPAEALPIYDELLAHGAATALLAHAHFERGQALLELGTFEQARAALELALTTDAPRRAPFRAAARRQLVSLALREGRLEDAEALLALGDARDGRQSTARSDRSAASPQASADPSEAPPDVQPDAHPDPHPDPQLVSDVAAAWLAAGEPARAERLFAELLRVDSDPHNPSDSRLGLAARQDARLRRAMALGRLGRHEEAVQEHAAIAAEARDVDGVDEALRAAAAVELAASLLTLGQRAEAISALGAALAGDAPPSIRAHAAVELARLAVEDGRHADALRFLEQVDGALAGSIPGAEGRAAVPPSAASSNLDATGGPFAALRDRALYLRAVAQLRGDDPRGAARTFAALRERSASSGAPADDPANALRRSALLLESEALLACGDPTAAIPLLEELLAGPPAEDAATALLRLGEATASAQRWVRSDEAFTRFLQALPAHELWFKARFGQGAAREAQGRFDSALEAYRDVAARHVGPTAARAQFQVGECLFALGQLEDAVRELVKVDLLHASPEWSAAALVEAGRCLAALGRHSEARAQFDDVLRRFPESRWATLAAEQRDAIAPASLPGRATSPPAANAAPPSPPSPAARSGNAGAAAPRSPE